MEKQPSVCTGPNSNSRVELSISLVVLVEGVGLTVYVMTGVMVDVTTSVDSGEVEAGAGSVSPRNGRCKSLVQLTRLRRDNRRDVVVDSGGSIWRCDDCMILAMACAS